MLKHIAEEQRRSKQLQALKKDKSKITAPTDSRSSLLQELEAKQPDQAKSPSKSSRSASKRSKSGRSSLLQELEAKQPEQAKKRRRARKAESPRTSTPRSPAMRGKHSYKQSATSSMMSGRTDIDDWKYKEIVGHKHKIIAPRQFENLKIQGKLNNIVPAVKRDMQKFRSVPRSTVGNLSEEQLKELYKADEARLQMMSDYFAQQIDQYRSLIEQCHRDEAARRNRGNVAGEAEVTEKDVQPTWYMYQQFYRMLDSPMDTVFLAYRRLRNTTSNKKIADYDHVLFDQQIKLQLYEQKVQFVHLVVKPWQCWMNLFSIDERAAKDICDAALLLLEHFNKVGRYKAPLPEWLVMLKQWEQRIAQEYLTQPCYMMEVLEHMKDGEYWARYHPYLREEHIEVFQQKWLDGTDNFPHRNDVVYWWTKNSQVGHVLTLEEYNLAKLEKGKKKKRTNTMGSSLGSVLNESDHKNEDGGDDDDDDDDDDEDEEEPANNQDDARMIDGGMEYLDHIELSEDELEDGESDYDSSSVSDDSIPVNKYYYRCPQPLENADDLFYKPPSSSIQDMLEEAKKQLRDMEIRRRNSYGDDFDEREEAELELEKQQKQNGITPITEHFAGWTAYHKSFVSFISRDLLNIEECERDIARNPHEDHWRRRHLHNGNGYDLPLCQYRLITKKLHLEHEITENLRMIATLKKNGIEAQAPLTQTKYMPEFVKFKALTHFKKLYPQIRKQQLLYSPHKKQFLETFREQIQLRKEWNARMRQQIIDRKADLQEHLNKLKMLYDRQISLLDYIVTAKHRVANAKLKVAYARKQVEILEDDVKDLREMTPREQEFAKRNKHYYEAVSINKLCKQYHSLKRNNYDENATYLDVYRQKIKARLKKVALYNLWFWALKKRYQSHAKWPVFRIIYDILNPTKDWDPSFSGHDSLITEFLSQEMFTEITHYDPQKLRREHFVFKRQKEANQQNALPDDIEHENEDEQKKQEEKSQEQQQSEEKSEEQKQDTEEKENANAEDDNKQKSKYYVPIPPGWEEADRKMRETLSQKYEYPDPLVDDRMNFLNLFTPQHEESSVELKKRQEELTHLIESELQRFYDELHQKSHKLGRKTRPNTRGRQGSLMSTPGQQLRARRVSELPIVPPGPRPGLFAASSNTQYADPNAMMDGQDDMAGDYMDEDADDALLDDELAGGQRLSHPNDDDFEDDEYEDDYFEDDENYEDDYEEDTDYEDSEFEEDEYDEDEIEEPMGADGGPQRQDSLVQERWINGRTHMATYNDIDAESNTPRTDRSDATGDEEYESEGTGTGTGTEYDESQYEDGSEFEDEEVDAPIDIAAMHRRDITRGGAAHASVSHPRLPMGASASMVHGPHDDVEYYQEEEEEEHNERDKKRRKKGGKIKLNNRQSNVSMGGATPLRAIGQDAGGSGYMTGMDFNAQKKEEVEEESDEDDTDSYATHTGSDEEEEDDDGTRADGTEDQFEEDFDDEEFSAMQRSAGLIPSSKVNGGQQQYEDDTDSYATHTASDEDSD